MVTIVMDQGLTAAIVQRKTLDTEHLNTAFWVNVGFGLLLTLSTIAVAGKMATLFGEPELKSVLQWLSLAYRLRHK